MQKPKTRPTPKERISRTKRVELMRTMLEQGKGYVDMVGVLGISEGEILRLALDEGLEA